MRKKPATQRKRHGQPIWEKEEEEGTVRPGKRSIRIERSITREGSTGKIEEEAKSSILTIKERRDTIKREEEEVSLVGIGRVRKIEMFRMVKQDRKVNEDRQQRKEKCEMRKEIPRIYKVKRNRKGSHMEEIGKRLTLREESLGNMIAKLVMEIAKRLLKMSREKRMIIKQVRKIDIIIVVITVVDMIRTVMVEAVTIGMVIEVVIEEAEESNMKRLIIRKEETSMETDTQRQMTGETRDTMIVRDTVIVKADTRIVERDIVIEIDKLIVEGVTKRDIARTERDTMTTERGEKDLEAEDIITKDIGEGGVEGVEEHDQERTDPPHPLALRGNRHWQLNARLLALMVRADTE